MFHSDGLKGQGFTLNLVAIIELFFAISLTLETRFTLVQNRPNFGRLGLNACPVSGPSNQSN